MKKIKQLTSILTFCLLLQIFSLPFGASEAEAAAPETSACSEELSVTRSDNIEWVYKKINGKYYKRLYNYSTGEWIGDWILVG